MYVNSSFWQIKQSVRAHTQWFNMEQKGIETPKLWMKKCSTDDDATKNNKTKQAPMGSPKNVQVNLDMKINQKFI